ncbi:TetR/AcrR family transcriptional regulator [Jongsikchunia kroppenstedtii]|uniref:TetR/AcrR family transcriptional regulator n=1 Tax=Jongsikchunia kroppenstedtii TaxID=1121721 RepID=UPI00036E7A18|nr:TetR/AcrR family transcriptional regulator [Jongsikchunia kroppenstedtii]
MSPRALDPGIRNALTDAAIRILGTEGRAALTTRRLAREADTSTTAVYTYFGSMDDVHRRVRREAISRLLSALDSVAATDDPVADLARAAAIQVEHGCANPAMYRLMFVDQPPDDADDPGARVFARLGELIARCIEHERFHPDEQHRPAMWAGEVWTMGHGAVMLALTRVIPVDQVAALHADMFFRLCVGFGDDRDRARESTDAAQA